MKKLGIGVIQVVAIYIFTFFCSKLSEILHIPIPGNILGIIILFILLQTKVIKLKWIELGGLWLLAELLLFFIPSAVGILQYKSIIVEHGYQILIIIIVSSIIVMLCSGILTDMLLKRKEKKEYDR